MELRNKSVYNAKWSIILASIGAIFLYGTNLFIGRIDPSLVGIYTLFYLVIQLIPTFLLFGGEAAIIKFLPEIDEEKKFSYVVSYLCLIILIGAVAIFIIWRFSQVLQLLLGETQTTFVPRFTIVMIPILLIQWVMISILESQIDTKIATFGINIPQILTFFAVIGLFKWINSENFSRFIFYILLFSYIVNFPYLCVKFYQLFLKKVRPRFNFFFPKNFLRFSSIVYITVVFVFIFQKIDLILVAKHLSTAELGIYRVATLIAELVRWFPILFHRTFFPLFSNLYSKKNTKELRDFYFKVLKINVLISFCIGFLILLFGDAFLFLLRREYIDGSFAMQLLSVTYLLTSVSMVNSALIPVLGKVEVSLGISILGSLIQISLTPFLIEIYGISGAALVKAVSLMICVLLGCIFIWKVMKLKPDKTFYYPLAIMALSFLVIHILNFNLLSFNYYFSRIFLLIFSFIILYLSKIINFKDIKKIYYKLKMTYLEK